MTELLVVVDMQVAYTGARDRALQEAVESYAADHKGPIVHVQYDDSGVSAVCLPDRTKEIWKRTDDGGDELYAFIVGAGLNKRDNRFVVGGVNTFACVLDTARQLGRRLRDEDGITGAVSIKLSLCGDVSSYCAIEL